MKITAEQFVESLARMSDAEKQKAANLLVNKKYGSRPPLNSVFVTLNNVFKRL